MTLAEMKERMGKWIDMEEVRSTVEDWRSEVLERFDGELFNRAADFVEKQKGWWEHQDWEGFIEDIRREGYELSDDVRNHVGLILERFKELYHDGALKRPEAAVKPTGKGATKKAACQPRAGRRCGASTKRAR